MLPSTLKLTLEQSALVPIYKEKWKKILISSEVIDRSKAKANTILLYRSIGLSKPKIIFVDTPYIAINIIFKDFFKLVLKTLTKEQLNFSILWEMLDGFWGGSVWGKIHNINRHKLSIEDCLKQLSILEKLTETEYGNYKKLSIQKSDCLEPLSILKKLTEKFGINTIFKIEEYGIYQINTHKSHITLSEEVFLYFDKVWNEVEEKIIINLVSQAYRQLKTLIEQHFPMNQQLPDYDILSLIDRCLWRLLENHYVRGCYGEWIPSLSIAYGFYYDFCYSVLGVTSLKKDLEILQDFFLNCYWIFPFKDVCLISGRPSKNKLMKLGISTIDFLK